MSLAHPGVSSRRAGLGSFAIMGPVATQTRITLTDDLDGSEPARTYRFAWQDTVYEVDLSDEHRDEFLRALQPYTTAGRRVSGAPSPHGAGT